MLSQMTPKATKEKNKLDFINIKTFVLQRAPESEIITHRMGGNFCKSCYKELVFVSNIYKELLQLKKTKFKNG